MNVTDIYQKMTIDFNQKMNEESNIIKQQYSLIRLAEDACLLDQDRRQIGEFIYDQQNGHIKYIALDSNDKEDNIMNDLIKRDSIFVLTKDEIIGQEELFGKEIKSTPITITLEGILKNRVDTNTSQLHFKF